MSLMRRVTKPLWGTGNKVLVDNGFCVLRGLVGVFEIIIYVSALAKKHRC